METLAKILFVNVPWTGHVNPTLVFVRALIQKGHQVSYINSAEWKEKIEATGATFIPYINYPSGNLDVKTIDTYSQVAAYTTALREIEKNDLLMYEAMFFLGETLSKQFKKKSIRLFTTFAINDHVLKRYCTQSNTWCWLCSKIIRKNYTNQVIGKIDLQEDDVYLEVSRNTADASFVFTTERFQIFRDEFGKSFHFLGAMVQENENEIGVLESVLQKEKIIYISMGSILKRKNLLKRCIKAFGNTEYTVIISMGGADPELLGKVPENVHVYRFVNQIAVLRRASLFITHGGMNSINEALFFQVPMLVIPMCNDQFVNANRVHELNLGCKMNRFLSFSYRIRKQTKKILEDKEMKYALEEMKKSMEQECELEKSVKVVEELVN